MKKEIEEEKQNKTKKDDTKDGNVKKVSEKLRTNIRVARGRCN